MSEKRPLLATQEGERWLDLTTADPSLGQDVKALVESSADWLARARVAAASAPEVQGTWHFRPTVPNPSKFLCLGLNDHDHAREAGYPVPEFPDVFMRVAASLVGHEQPLVCPVESTQFDYEVELAVVVGKRGRRIAPQSALEHVAGYTLFNDGTLRDYQLRTSQWTLGKNFPRTGALGPTLVTPDELPEGARGLAMSTRIGDEILQKGNTRSMIFAVSETLALLSRVYQLEPGDVIAFGTPAGVGVARNPQRFLQPGEECVVEIEGIGELRNPIVREETL